MCSVLNKNWVTGYNSLEVVTQSPVFLARTGNREARALPTLYSWVQTPENP